VGEILLDVRNLSVTLDGNPVLSNLSFRVEKGEFLTILGPNGSGKTVLIKSLLGLLPYQGEVIWHGTPKLGYLPQGLSQMSMRDLPLSVADFFALKERKRDEALKHLAHVGLPANILDRRAGHLSGGEFQRMLIAWVLSSEPSVLFLDEPTAAVDIAGGETISSLLSHVWREHQLTIFNITHDLNVVFARSTHVLCLSRRGHSCFGVPKEVLTPAVLNDMYAADVKFYMHAGGPAG
jgi:zinc transport system ATP-binding protein